jgi:hypothetical protein
LFAESGITDKIALFCHTWQDNHPTDKERFFMTDKGQRIVIHRVALADSGSEVSIELKYANKIFQGKAPSGVGEYAQMMAAANALIAAINSIIPTPIVTRVAEIQQVRFQSLAEVVIVTMVGIKIKGQEMLFSGSAKIEGQLLQSVVRATLDAVNRPIGMVL